MLLEAVEITILISICAAHPLNDKSNRSIPGQDVSQYFNRNFTEHVTEHNLNEFVTHVLSKESEGLENVTNGVLEKYNQSVTLGHVNEHLLTSGHTSDHVLGNTSYPVLGDTSDQILRKTSDQMLENTSDHVSGNTNGHVFWNDSAHVLWNENIFNTTDSIINDEEFNDFYFNGSLSELLDNQQNNNSGQIYSDVRTVSNKGIFTTDITTAHDRNTVTTESMYPVKVLNQNVNNNPYDIQYGDDTLALERWKVQLQHHLQLVPMENEPLGAIVLKNQRYMISVLVPIGVGMIGAVMIVCTILTLKKVAKNRTVLSPLDDDVEAPERSMRSPIASISADTTDKMVLLLGDDEI